MTILILLLSIEFVVFSLSMYVLNNIVILDNNIIIK